MSSFFSKFSSDNSSLSNLLQSYERDFWENRFSTNGEQILLCKLDEAKVDHDKSYLITQQRIYFFDSCRVHIIIFIFTF